MKIQLYTCGNGVKLIKLGLPFGAWDSNSNSYKNDDENIIIFVDKNDVMKDGDGYTVSNTNPVEIIG